VKKTNKKKTNYFLWPVYSQRVQIAFQIKTRQLNRQILIWDYIRVNHRGSTATWAKSRNTWNSPTSSADGSPWCNFQNWSMQVKYTLLCWMF